ncbi:hypothetical protein CPC16_005052 [Podila verticillata]|nr:hypothetical protein BGZ52_002465 [Haplosporangium bisporale]KAF9214752.1 hypothetical protein BGZ59_003050 [Podila verticillata]KAF9368798.1 hypothetical protein CPC16_005052 [Podila verticillata]KAI9234875.1 MAG: DOPA-like domain-containing protein [Podila humilis]KFH66929.1 hypothetical protein MVEG_07454 [Podila verticillata NRRL 6337]
MSPTNSIMSLSLSSQSTPDSLKSTIAAEVKEYHFHLYYFENNAKSRASAVVIRNRLGELVDQGYLKVVPQTIYGGVFPGPTGPHVIGSFEVWCPIEGFARMFSWFTLNRGSHSVLVHPLTKEQLVDHTDRAIWMGQSLPLDFEIFKQDVLDYYPLEYPEYGLGYSAKGAIVA